MWSANYLSEISEITGSCDYSWYSQNQSKLYNLYSNKIKKWEKYLLLIV